MTDPLLEAIGGLLAALDRLQIIYCVVGSLASGAWGVYRATADGDVLAELSVKDAERLAAELGKDWYADAEMIRSALRAGRSFNVIHLPTAQKVDLFPAADAFGRNELGRASRVTLRFPGGDLPCPVAAAEDVLLAKLQWYRLGGEVSDRQWSDITGILATNKTLDTAYLDHWARELGVTDLLVRARADAAQP